MNPVSPDLGIPEITIAKDQEPYRPLVGAPIRFDDGSSGILTRWELSDDERRRVAEGEDLFLAVLTYGQPLQPLQLAVGAPMWLQEGEEAEATEVEEEPPREIAFGAAVIGCVIGFVLALLLLAAIGYALAE